MKLVRLDYEIVGSGSVSLYDNTISLGFVYFGGAGDLAYINGQPLYPIPVAERFKYPANIFWLPMSPDEADRTNYVVTFAATSETRELIVFRKSRVK